MAFLASVNKLKNSRKTKAQIAERKRPPESEEGAFWLHFICVGSKSLKDSDSFLAFCLLCKLHSSAPPQIISANSGRGLGADGGMYLGATKWCFMISYLWVIGAAASALALAPDPTPFACNCSCIWNWIQLRIWIRIRICICICACVSFLEQIMATIIRANAACPRTNGLLFLHGTKKWVLY